MRPRLVAAHALIADRGAIFVSIDDNDTGISADLTFTARTALGTSAPPERKITGSATKY